MSTATRLLAHIDRGFMIDCSRCSNEEFSYALGALEAAHEFADSGWTSEYPRAWCPECSVETGRQL